MERPERLIFFFIAAAVLGGCGSDSTTAPRVPTATATAVAVATATATAGTGATPTATATAPAAQVITIAINGQAGGMSYTPANATIHVGDTVKWTNTDSISHTATQNGGGFDTGIISPGATSTGIVMTTAGTMNYHCSIHPTMTGALTVM
jgi:plastocyanin